jgi:hypothetical protein
MPQALGFRNPLARIPLGWLHPSEKNSRQIIDLEHVVIGKVCNFAATCYRLDRRPPVFHHCGMANKPRTPRSAAETKRLAEALRINLLKRKSLARLKKTIVNRGKQASE